MDIQSQEEFLEHEKMLPPPITHFQSREELIEQVSGFARSQGYIINIRKSEKDRKVILKCDRGGVYKDTRKATTSHDHNHKAFEDISGHPSSRRFSKEDILRIKEVTIAGIQPHQILTSLRQGNPQLLAISRDVYNCISKIRRDILAGRTAIQALLDELADGGFHYNAKNDEEGRLTHLFFAHPKSITLSKNYSNVFVMDCTYKTNKYKMPLLDIVGVTSFNSSFYSCFAFLQKEEREDYVWALTMFNDMLDNVSRPTVIVTDRELALMRAIKIVFPGAMNLLCVSFPTDFRLLDLSDCIDDGV
ncbi:protein FAR1-RELATED SEQUENCE 5-like [Tasmannia lanceolata]|uniref:protein FAR1-RELATED SEQUENCE 5-like n=1 Tax=Tasmannia lanceolata TaxID=3420 RepID=UPI004062E370